MEFLKSPLPVTVVGGGSVPNPIQVINPAPLGSNIPLDVNIANSGLDVSPATPNFPAVNLFKKAIPEDGSAAEMDLQTTDVITAPYFFRDVHDAGDVVEFCGNFLPVMRLYVSNPLYATMEIYYKFTVQLVASTGTVLYSASDTYSAGFVERCLMILPGTLHVPSCARTGLQHTFKLEVMSIVPFTGKVDAEALLLSHYDLDGSMPS